MTGSEKQKGVCDVSYQAKGSFSAAFRYQEGRYMKLFILITVAFPTQNSFTVNEERRKMEIR